MSCKRCEETGQVPQCPGYVPNPFKTGYCKECMHKVELHPKVSLENLLVVPGVSCRFLLLFLLFLFFFCFFFVFAFFSPTAFLSNPPR
jgi:hypothetical protein